MSRACYKLGDEAWFIGDYGRWFRVKVIAREQNVMTIQSMTGLDAERQVAWPHPDGLRFQARGRNRTYLRMRPANARSLQ